MAVPACFHLADRVFPRVRAHAARSLLAQGWKQGRIADALGVSQAMVSKYQSRHDEEADLLVVRLSEELVAELGHPRPATGPSSWCDTLTRAQERPGAAAALEDLLAAERRLLDAAPVKIMPEVGLNIARALPEAAGAGDVLAYPARIVAAGDRLLRPAPPELGASRHLAACLLALRRQDPELHAVANIRGGDTLARAAGAAFSLPPQGDRVAAFEEAVRGSPTPPTVVHDPGAMGIEPCLYIAAPDARSVVARILEIAQKVRP